MATFGDNGKSNAPAADKGMHKARRVSNMVVFFVFLVHYFLIAFGRSLIEELYFFEDVVYLGPGR